MEYSIKQIVSVVQRMRGILEMTWDAKYKRYILERFSFLLLQKKNKKNKKGSVLYNYTESFRQICWMYKL